MSEAMAANEIKVVAPQELTVDDLTLRMTRADDVDEAYQMHEANRDFWAVYLDYAAGYTYEKAQADYQRATQLIKEGKLIDYWIIRNGQKLGDIGMTFLGNNRAELGFKLTEVAQGEGVATRAARRVMEYGFKERNLDAIELHIKPTNEPSRKVAQRLGAKLVGKTKDGVFDIWEARQ